MNFCHGSSGWAFFFRLCEVIVLKWTVFAFTRKVYLLYRDSKLSSYEFNQGVLIGFSLLQIYLLFFSSILGTFFGLEVLSSLAKFTQNLLIIGILVSGILISLKIYITLEQLKCFIASLVILDFLSFISAFCLEYSFFETQACYSNTLNSLVLISLVLNCIIVAYSLYKSFEEKDEQERLTNLVGDGYNLNWIEQRSADSIKKMNKYYFILLITFTLSFFIEAYFKVFSSDYSKAAGTEIISNYTVFKNLSKDFSNGTHIMNFTLEPKEGISENTTHPEFDFYNDNNTNVISTAECGKKNFDSEFAFKEYLICLISFLFRDIAPHIYLYQIFFNNGFNDNRRSASIIETF
jgi:hypothetical protein